MAKLRRGKPATAAAVLLLFASLTAACGGGTASAPSYYQNPLAVKGIADPYVLRASDGMYYLYPTTVGEPGFGVWSSSDLVNWKKEGAAYAANGGSWDKSLWWAPEVQERHGTFTMFFSAQNGEGKKRVGIAVSDRPTGPFREALGHPLFDLDAIDADVFTDDDGQSYLYYSGTLKPDPATGKMTSMIYGIRLNADWTSVQGDPVELLKPIQAWETGGVNAWNEGPFMLKHNGTYYLMYSANCYCNRNYGVGYATSGGPLGTFAKYAGNPVLAAKSPDVSGTGHNSVVKSPDNSEWFIVYHSHVNPKSGGGLRQLNIDRMGFRADGTLYVDGPTLSKQPYPASNRK